MKKYVAWLLLAVALFGLCACGAPKNESEGNSTANEAQSAENSIRSELLVSELSEYKIIYKSGSSLNVLKKIRALQGAIEEKYGVELPSSTDSAKQEQREILIGITNRPESEKATADAPRVKDYAISIIDKKIAVTAYREETLLEAIDKLTELIRAAEDEKLFFTSDCEIAVLGEYPMDKLSLCGNAVADYTVVYADNAEGLALAERIRDTISEYSGYVLDLSRDPVKSKMILVGNTVKGAPAGMSPSADSYCMTVYEENLYLYGAELVSACKAVDSFCRLLASAKGREVDIDPNRGEVSSPDTSLTAMTFNVYWDTEDGERVNNVIDTVRKHSPDSFGVQEATGVWMERLSDALGDEYAYVGKGRFDNGSASDEFCAIFYKKSRFELVESGTKWLSDTPDVAGSKMSGAAYPRIFTYAVLKDTETDRQIVHINTHTDHLDSATRLAQVVVITRFLRENYAELPVFITGDMNDTANADSIQHLLSAGFESASETALLKDNANTFKETTIDYLLMRKNSFIVYSYDVDTDKYNGEYPSDHRAVVIKYDVKTEKNR